MARKMETRNLNPMLKAFLEGVYDEDCVLFNLKGIWHLLKVIWGHVEQFWKDNLKETRSILYKDRFDEGDIISYLNLNRPIDYEKFPFIAGCAYDFGDAKIKFPRPKGTNINMMPFIFGRNFKECRLPKYLKKYWENLIIHCICDENDYGKVCYLTIHESKVKKQVSQRRGGLHTERPGRLELRSGEPHMEISKGGGSSKVAKFQVFHHWGMGIGSYNNDRFDIKGGIYMASNVADSCRVWDCQVLDDKLIGHLGDIEHLRCLLPESENMAPNCIYWLTDRTPHESLPLKETTYRQYFRLVTSQVSLWFEDHSTKNPMGVVPDPNTTKIVRGSKFNEGEAYIVTNTTE